MSLKAMEPLPRQFKEHPEVRRDPKGVISKGQWEKRIFEARRFKKEPK